MEVFLYRFMRVRHATAPIPAVGFAGPVALGLLLLLMPGMLCAQEEVEDRSEKVRQAQELIARERFGEARGIYEALVAGDPQDKEARIWVARLTAWQGDYDDALTLYQTVLDDDPGDFEVQLGVADVLGWQHRYDEAMALLQRLDAERPEHPDVLVRIARLHRWQNHRQEAIDYYRRTLAVDPDNRDAADALESLLAQRSFQFESGYRFEEFDFIGDTNGQFVQLSYRDFDRVTLFGRFLFQDKFNQTNTQSTVGLGYRLGGRTWLLAEFSGAPPNDTVIANTDLALELEQVLPGGSSFGGGLRLLDFDVADVRVLTLAGAWQPTEQVRLSLRYTPARTRFKATGQSVWNQSGSIRLRWEANRHFAPFLLFGVGAESFEGLSTDRLGRFAAQVYGAGAEVRFARGQGIRIGYSYQNRTQDRRQQGFDVSYFFSFK